MTGTAVSHQGAAGAVVRRPLSARVAAICSLTAHAAVILAAVLITRLSVPPALPPAYAVELVAAPSGPRALGSVREGPTVPDTPAPATPEPEAARPTPEVGPSLVAKKPVIAKPAVKPPAAKPAPAPAKPVAPRSGGATAVPGKTPAGGGPTGGRGRDVASVKVQGIAFPYPGYLENITRQIALNFKPRAGGALRAEVTFLIHRDGSVSDLRLLSRSGAYAFDLECMGAVEAVGQRRSFGPLPSGFSDDVLPVVFSFDPSVLR
jgi:periplasmic protein TonB